MLHQDGSVSSSEDAAEGVIRFEKVNGNSAVDVEDSAEDVTYSDKEAFDNSSDDYNKRRDKRSSNKQSKSKVKIKTLTIDGQLVYFCKICDKVFTRRKDKLNHELAHSGESVLTCTECGKEYLHESSLASHMRTHAGDPLFMCDLCPKMFAQSHHLKTHILSHSEPTNFVCKTCYKEFPTASDLNRHNRVQSKLEIANYWCKMCKVYFCRTHKLACDTRLHAFCCSACNELFHTHKKLKIHMKKFAHYSLDKPKYIEPLQEHELYPDKLPENMKKLQPQKESDLARKPLKNDVNGKRQSDSYSDGPFKKFKLSVRKLIIDGDQSSTSVQDSATEISKEEETELKSPTRHRKGKPYCKKCNKSFKDSIDLDRHKALVHEDKQHSFKCEICSMEFASKDDLDRHGFKHSGQRMHMCPVCGQEFTDSPQLTQHLRIHVGDFPYKCTQCGKAFRLKIQLIQHVRLHIAQEENGADKCPGSPGVGDEQLNYPQGEVENFKCHQCSLSFCFRHQLLNHMKLHTSVKCFQCYICQKTFVSKCNLQRHLQIHAKQGMDVDMHNIIVDGDSKSELDSLREQVGREDFQTTQGILNHHGIDSVEKEDLKQPFFGMKRSILNFELESRANDNSNFDINTNEVQGHSLSIKVEAEDDMDSFSERSFSSTFTRDSERSDPFKFSSDESYTFKTVMAKERRRLRRRYKKKRDLLMQSTLQDLSELKKKTEDINSDILCAKVRGDREDDVTDMMVELNAVTSEFDDVTTVFVNLTEKKMISCEQTVSSCVTETSLVNDSSSLPKIELNVKEEVEQDYQNYEQGAPESNVNDIVNAHENADQAKSSGKMLMFEFDAERLLDSHIKCNEENTDVTSDNHIVENYVIGEEAKAKTGKARQIQRAENTVSLSQSLQPSNQKSPLKFIVEDANLTSESSNLEKLQAVFEHSSKYLPLPHTSTSRKISAPVHQNEAQISRKEESTLNSLTYSHSMNSCNSLSQEKQTFITQVSCDEKVTMLPLQISQNNALFDQKPQQVTPEDMDSNLDPKTGSLHGAKILEESLKTSLTTSEINRAEIGRKDSVNKIPKENSSSSNSQVKARKIVKGSHNSPDIHSENITLMMSQPFSGANITSGTSQSSNLSTSTVTTRPSNYSNFNLMAQPSVLVSTNLTSQSSCHNSSNLTSQPSCHSSSNLTSRPSNHSSSNFMPQSSSHTSSNVTSQSSSHTSSNVTSQPSRHTGSNFTSQPSGHPSANLLAEPHGPTTSRRPIKSAGQGYSNLMAQPAGHRSSSLTSLTSDNASLMLQSAHAGSSHIAQPSSHSNSMLISQSIGHTSSAPMIKSVHTSSAPMIQSVHTSSAPMVQSVHTSSTPMVQSVHTSSTPVTQSVYSSSTPMVQSVNARSASMVQTDHAMVHSVHASFTPMVQSTFTPVVQSSSTPLVHSIFTPVVQSNSTPVVQSSSTPVVQSRSTPVVQPDLTASLPMQHSGHNSTTLCTQPFSDTSSMSMQLSTHPTSMSPGHHNISGQTAHISTNKTSNVPAHTLSHRTSVNSQNVTPKSSSLLAQQSHGSLTAPLPTSLASPLYCSSVIGTSSSEVGYLQPASLNFSSLSMKLNPVLTSASTSSDNITVNSGYVTNENHPASLLGFISANPLVNPQCAIGLSAPAHPSFSLAVNQNFALNPSTIFDASNPVYRDMNMLDLISTSSSDLSQPVAATNIGFFNQGGLETQMRHDIAPPLGLQSGILQSQNPLLNIGNPTIGTNFGISGNPVRNFFPHRIIPVGFGQLDNQIFTTGPVGVGGADGTLFNIGNVYSTLPRDVQLSNTNVPHLCMQLGHAGGSVPLDIANILSLNTGGFSDMGSLRTGNIRGPLPMNITDLGGSSFISTGNLPLNQASYSSDFPFSIPSNPHMINNLSSLGIFPNSGLQSNIGNLIAPSNINFLNPPMIQQNTGLLPGSSTGFINDFSTGFFPNF